MRLALILLLTGLFTGASAQSGLIMQDGSYLVVSGAPYIRVAGNTGNVTLNTNAHAIFDNANILVQGNWNNHGTINAGTSTVTMDGSTTQTMFQNGNALNKLTINNGAGVQMLNSFSVNNQVLLSAGILNTGANDTLFLGTTGSLINEDNGHYVTGHVQGISTLNTATANPGNTGVSIQSSENLGTVTVTRSAGLLANNLSYATYPLDNALSIDRIWNIQTTSSPSSPLVYSLQWLSSNDHGVNLNAAQVWHENTVWDTVGNTTLDASARSVAFSTLNTGRFTIGKSYIVTFIVSATADTACSGNITNIIDQSVVPGSGYSYEWDFQNDGITDQTTVGNTSVEYPAAGTYTVKLIITNSIGQKDSTTFDVTVNASPSVDAGDPVAIELGETTLLGATASTDVTDYNWTPSQTLSDASISSPTASPKNTTTYKVTVTNIFGCTASDSVQVTVNIFIPTGFTPDGDGTNDTWEIPALENFPSATVKVFDRAGQPVFTGGNATFWDGTFNGKKSPTEAYYYIIDLGDGSEVLTGYVSIIRLKK